MDDNGVIYATITNTSYQNASEIKCQIADTAVKSITAEILTGHYNQYNDFGNEDSVKTEEFDDFTKCDDGFTAVIPPCSVVKFVIEK